MRLTKLCVGIALWLALGAAAPAGAASTVTLTFQLESGGFGSTAVWGLYVTNSLGVGIGAVDVLVEGATGFNLDLTNPGISGPDSVYRVQPIPGQPWDALIVNNTAFGVAIAPAGATTRLGAFLPGDVPYLLPGETPDPTGPGTVLGGTIFDVNLNVITASRIDPTQFYCDPGGCFGPTGLIITVPEPAAAPAAVTLLCLAYLLGGKIRRRSGSVAAPT